MTGYPQIGFNPYNMYQSWGYSYQYPAFRGMQNQPQPISVPQPNVNLQTPPDTVSFRATEHIQTKPKKEGLSTGAKWGLGALALAGIGTVAYLATRGKVGAKQAQQLAEHIEFKPAKTIEEAKTFAKDRLGVNIKFDDVDMANYINEALTTANNATKGKSVMPNSVFVDKSNGFFAWRRYSDKPADLVISPSAYRMGAVARDKGISVKEFYMNHMWKENRFADKGLSPFKEIFHELGHGNHYKACKDYEKMVKLKELKARGISDTHFTEEFISETKNNKAVKDFFDSVGYTSTGGSIYALESPAEFVADVFSLKVQGKSIPEEVQRIYSKYGGPALT